MQRNPIARRNIRAMTPPEAWSYAAQWGSYIREGDPGACMYGFDEKFVMQSEDHRQSVIQQMAANREHVMERPDDYADDELRQIDSFMLAVYAAPVAED